MANEIRPRREPSTSRIRKTVAPTAPPVGDDPVAPAPVPVPSYPKASEPAPGAIDKQRDRQDREPYREEGPADREPIRFIRQRDREPVREPVVEREPVLSVRERLARDRAERDGGPIHHEGIPMARDRDRDPAPPARERARDHDTGGPGAGPGPNYRDRSEREAPYIPREREYSPPVRTERPAPPPTYVDPPAEFPDVEDDIFGDAALHDRYEDIKRGEIHLTELQKMTMPQLIRTAKTGSSRS
jgi:transcription termination factor Rho